MTFRKLSSFLEKLEKTASRIEITRILADLFNKTSEDEIGKVVYLLLGGLAPQFKQVVFNVAERMMLDVVAKAYDKDLSNVKKLYKEKGDIGNVVYAFAKKSKTPNIQNSKLNVGGVYNRLLQVAQDEGEGSVQRKIDALSKLLKNLDPQSAKFVARIPIGKLRLGFSDKTIIDALSWMETESKSKSKQLEKAYFVVPDVGQLAKAVKERGIDKALEGIRPKVGVPILPMLAQRLKSPKEMIKKMGEVSIEPKFDGLRIQIHFSTAPRLRGASKAYIKVYTRNLNETSWMFPELGDISKQIKAKEIVLDTEAVGVDENTKKMANFQMTMTRRRKHDIEETLEHIGIKFYVFDVLYKDGKSFLDDPYTKRREILQKSLLEGKRLKLVDYEITDSPARISELMNMELKEGLEGIIIKRANSRYVAGRTGWRWVKMKEAESMHAKLADTIDCVVLGFTRGKGRRAGFGVGQFLAGILKGNKYLTITKVGTGITDEQFLKLNKRLSDLVIKKKPKEYDVHKDLEPDFWVEPKLVVELAADEITKSPKHTAGFALRFPRLIKFRDDKSASQATSLKEIKKLFKLQ